MRILAGHALMGPIYPGSHTPTEAGYNTAPVCPGFSSPHVAGWPADGGRPRRNDIVQEFTRNTIQPISMPAFSSWHLFTSNAYFGTHVDVVMQKRRGHAWAIWTCYMETMELLVLTNIDGLRELETCTRRSSDFLALVYKPVYETSLQHEQCRT